MQYIACKQEEQAARHLHAVLHLRPPPQRLRSRRPFGVPDGHEGVEMKPFLAWIRCGERTRARARAHTPCTAGKENRVGTRWSPRDWC